MAQKLMYEILLPQTSSFIPPFPCVLRGFFRGSVSPRAPNTIPERGITEGTRVGARRRSLILRHESGPEFYRKLARILSLILPQDHAEFLTPFFHAPKKSTPNPRHLRGQNPCQFWELFSQWFLWVLDPGLRRCFWIPIFLCRPKKTCKLANSAVGDSSNTTQRASTE